MTEFEVILFILLAAWTLGKIVEFIGTVLHLFPSRSH